MAGNSSIPGCCVVVVIIIFWGGGETSYLVAHCNIILLQFIKLLQSCIEVNGNRYD